MTLSSDQAFEPEHQAGAHCQTLRDTDTIFRRETGWGYSLTQQDGRDTMRRRAELGLRGVSFLSVLAMGALWLWPGASFALGLLGIKFGLSIFLGILGLSLGYLAERGLRRDVQIDVQRKQLRIVWLNRRSETRLHTVIGFDEIGSVFLRRSPIPGQTTYLDLRFGPQGEVETLFKGREEVLRALWYDLNTDLRTDPMAPVMPVKVNAMPARQARATRQSAVKPLPRALR